MVAVPTPYEEAANWTTGYMAQVGPVYRYQTGADYGLGFRVAENHVNGLGRCHGGMLMGFADMAFGFAIAHIHKRHWVTVRLLTDFVSSAEIGEWVEGKAQITGQDGDFFFVKGRVWTGERTILQGSGTFKALGPRE